MELNDDIDTNCVWCGKPCRSNNKYDESFCSMKCVHEFHEKGHNVTKKSCFIATAACQSCGHPIVVDLRKFRDEYLEKNQFGRMFICFYYKHGPKAAKLLSNNFIRILTLYVVIKPIHLLVKRIVKWREH
jgi:hypothetical protein